MANLEPEAGIFYAVCWIVVIIRLTSRRMQRGTWKRLQLDDYLILAAMVRIYPNNNERIEFDCSHISRPRTPFSTQ
jgi:hypothetical protein